MDTQESIIRTQWIKLPQHIREFVGGLSWVPQIRAIGERSGLSGKQLDLLQFEFSLVLIALSSLDDFTDELIDQLGIPGDVALSIATEARSTLLVGIDAELMSLVAKGSTPIPPEIPVTNTAVPSSTQPIPFVHEPQDTAPTSIFEEKLKRVFTVPRADARLSVGSTPLAPVPNISVASVPSRAPMAPTPVPTPPPAPRTGTDPYREPAA